MVIIEIATVLEIIEMNENIGGAEKDHDHLPEVMKEDGHIRHIGLDQEIGEIVVGDKTKIIELVYL